MENTNNEITIRFWIEQWLQKRHNAYEDIVLLQNIEGHYNKAFRNKSLDNIIPCDEEIQYKVTLNTGEKPTINSYYFYYFKFSNEDYTINLKLKLANKALLTRYGKLFCEKLQKALENLYPEHSDVKNDFTDYTISKDFKLDRDNLEESLNNWMAPLFNELLSNEQKIKKIFSISSYFYYIAKTWCQLNAQVQLESNTQREDKISFRTKGMNNIFPCTRKVHWKYPERTIYYYHIACYENEVWIELEVNWNQLGNQLSRTDATRIKKALRGYYFHNANPNGNNTWITFGLWNILLSKECNSVDDLRELFSKRMGVLFEQLIENEKGYLV